MKKKISKTQKNKKKKVIKKVAKKSTTKITKAKTKRHVKSKAKPRPKVKAKIKAKSKVKTKTKTRAKVGTKAKTKTKTKVKKTGAKTKIKLKLKKIVPKPIKKSVASLVTTLDKEGTIFDPGDISPYRLKKGEEYMSEEQLEHFRNVLLQWKTQLMDEVDRTMHHMQEEVSNYPDPIDRASQEEEFNLELRSRDRERKLLRKIEEALNRINDHDYGYCDDCGAEIGIKRLEARPTATQCIECKTISEIREKQIGESSLFD